MSVIPSFVHNREIFLIDSNSAIHPWMYNAYIMICAWFFKSNSKIIYWCGNYISILDNKPRLFTL